MPAPLDTWQRLLEPSYAALIEAASLCDPSSIRDLEKLRRDHDADLVTAAIQLTHARHKAAIKFPELAATLIADLEGVEQATSLRVARYKAERFASYRQQKTANVIVHDLCCGIGGDAIALHEAGMDVIALDADPVRAWMTAQNAGVETQCAAVESWLEHLDAHDHNALYHIDPGRRIADAHNTGKRRIRRLADYQPGPEFLRRLIGRLPHGAVKLGPGIEFHDLADQLTDHLPAHELEFISEQGRLVQAVLWTGELATQASHGAQGSAIIALRTATRLPDAVSLTGTFPYGRQVG